MLWNIIFFNGIKNITNNLILFYNILILNKIRNIIYYWVYMSFIEGKLSSLHL